MRVRSPSCKQRVVAHRADLIRCEHITTLPSIIGRACCCCLKSCQRSRNKRKKFHLLARPKHNQTSLWFKTTRVREKITHQGTYQALCSSRSGLDLRPRNSDRSSTRQHASMAHQTIEICRATTGSPWIAARPGFAYGVIHVQRGLQAAGPRAIVDCLSEAGMSPRADF